MWILTSTHLSMNTLLLENSKAFWQRVRSLPSLPQVPPLRWLVTIHPRIFPTPAVQQHPTLVSLRQTLPWIFIAYSGSLQRKVVSQ